MNPFKKLRAYLQLTNAINKADSAHLQDGDVYYILPAINGKLLITDRKNFKLLKKKGYIRKNRTMQDVKKGCFYATANAGGQPTFSDAELKFRRTKFYEWSSHH